MMCSLLVHYVGRKVIQFIHFIVPKIKFKLHKNSQLSRWAQMTSYWLENLTRQKYWIIILSDMDTPKKMVALQDSPSFQFIKSRFELYVST